MHGVQRPQEMSVELKLKLRGDKYDFPHENRGVLGGSQIVMNRHRKTWIWGEPRPEVILHHVHRGVGKGYGVCWVTRGRKDPAHRGQGHSHPEVRRTKLATEVLPSTHSKAKVWEQGQAQENHSVPLQADNLRVHWLPVLSRIQFTNPTPRLSLVLQKKSSHQVPRAASSLLWEHLPGCCPFSRLNQTGTALSALEDQILNKWTNRKGFKKKKMCRHRYQLHCGHKHRLKKREGISSQKGQPCQ